MTPNEYQEAAQRTAPPIDDQARKLIEAITRNPELASVIISAQKLCSEAGELNDAIVKHIAYGLPLDTFNILEECGDLQWYINDILAKLGYDTELCLMTNVDKLRIRYPEKFTEKDAIERKDKK